jgi:hypothetical protein
MFNSIIGSTITLPSFLICIFTAMIIGILTALAFSYHSRQSASFSITLALLPMAVATVIMLVNGSIGTGIAVAGAFTLVRFRSVPGTAREIAAIFSAMTCGLALGMGYVGVAVIFFVLISLLTIALTALRFGSAPSTEKELKITIPENFDYNELFDDVFAKYTSRARLAKVRTTNMGTLYELTYDVSLPDGEVPKIFLDELRTRNGNLTISIGDFSAKDSL